MPAKPIVLAIEKPDVIMRAPMTKYPMAQGIPINGPPITKKRMRS
jgi:hypothetical protein